MKINIGYPGEYDDYSEIEVKSFAEGGSLVENMMNISVYQKILSIRLFCLDIFD